MWFYVAQMTGPDLIIRGVSERAWGLNRKSSYRGVPQPYGRVPIHQTLWYIPIQTSCGTYLSTHLVVQVPIHPPCSIYPPCGIHLVIFTPPCGTHLTTLWIEPLRLREASMQGRSLLTFRLGGGGVSRLPLYSRLSILWYISIPITPALKKW